jgi:hypothetical protein
MPPQPGTRPIRNSRVAPHAHDSGRRAGKIAAHHREMTMNTWIRRVSIAAASTALAGGALLGAGGSASAATASGPAEHTRPSIAAPATGSARDGHREDRYRSGHHGEQDDGRDAPRGWYKNDDRQGHHDARHDHRTQQERRDGRHLHVRDGHRRAEATTWYGVGSDRWYLDQVAWNLHQR